MATETEGPSGNEDDAPTQSIMPDGEAPSTGASSPNKIDLTVAEIDDAGLEAIIDELAPAKPMSPEEFAEQVEKTRTEVAIQTAEDLAKRERHLSEIAQLVKDVLNGTRVNLPAESHTRRQAKETEAIGSLLTRLKEINFTEADAVWTARLLEGNVDWQMGTENGRWYLQETKVKNPKRFSTTFRFASGAMRVMTLLNTGHPVVDAKVLATVGASQRLEDLIKTLDEDLQREFNTLLEYLDKPVL